MKKINLFLVFISFSLGSYAQVDKEDMMEARHETHNMRHSDDHEARAMIYADKVATRLSLTLEQKEKIREAKLKKLEDQKDLMASMLNEKKTMAGEKSEMHEEKKQLQSEFKKEMKEILTEAQYSKWKNMHEREMKMNEKAYKMKKDKESKKMEQ